MSKAAKATRSARPEGELADRVRQQVRLLQAAADRFDGGAVNSNDEALNMAIRLRALLYTSRTSHPALGQAGYLNTTRFTSSVGRAPNDSKPFIGFLQQELNAHPEYVGDRVAFKAPLGSVIRTLTPGQQARRIANSPSFEEWWHAVILRDNDGRQFTREAIVLAVANTDGGGHVDPTLDDDYLAVSRGPGFGISIRIGDEPEHQPRDPVPAMIRQITWEFEQSLRRAAPSLIA